MCFSHAKMLPSESLVDVFNCVDRRSLDGFHVVCRRYNQALQLGISPLRPVYRARFFYNRKRGGCIFSQLFLVAVCRQSFAYPNF